MKATMSNSGGILETLEAETIEELRDKVIHQRMFIAELGDTIKFLEESE